MKRNKLNIIGSWILLVCFMAGQYMAMVHQHKLLKQTSITYSINKHQHIPVTTVQEKCYLCDTIHHTAAILNNTIYCSAITAIPYIYKVGDHAFISISLILASGRGPPISIVC
ncbi:MAG: hypothetical protein ABI367_00190 [Mucilaginibacter sp.]